MLTHFGIQNLRSYGMDNQLIDLKKINLFVGRNSSGKSTFLRILPLLRQSLEVETISPILWFGKYVDFGDIQTVKNDDYKKSPVIFNFRINIKKEDFDMKYYWLSSLSFEDEEEISRWYVNIFSDMPKNIHVTASLSLISEQEYNITLALDNFKHKIVYKIVDEKLQYFQLVYDDCVVDLSVDFERVRRTESLFPAEFYSTVYKEIDNSNRYYINRKNLTEVCWSQMIKEITKSYSRVPSELKQKCTYLSLMSTQEDLKQLFNGNIKIIKRLNHDQDLVRIIQSYSFGAISTFLLNQLNQKIDSYFKSVKYIGPLRANSDRYYRYQGVQVNELDHTGSNLPMILQSLKQRSRDELSNWIQEQLNFQIKLVLKDQHYAIEIKADGDEKYHNITDMGFGYSQILPIAVAIWFELQNKDKRRVVVSSKARRYKQKQVVFAIEQPELHLHPAMQYDFGIMVAKLSSLANNLDINIVLETHSKAIIDAISNEIYDKHLDKNNVSISLFQKNSESQTVITKAYFDAQGYLMNWPAGFLSVGDRL